MIKNMASTNKLAKLVAVSSVCLVAGCVTPVNNYRPVAFDVSDPPLGLVVIKGVGEEMLKQGKFVMLDVLNVQSPVKVGLGHYTIEQGLYALMGSDESANYYKVGGMGSESGSITMGIGQQYVSVMLKRKEGELCVTTIHSTTACGPSSDSRYALIKKPVIFEDSVQQTLIYNGKIGNKITLGYRTTVGKSQNQAYSNNVEYDLGESNLVGYKGAEIEILEATNRSIRYKVIRNFNDAINFAPQVPSNKPDEKKQDI